MSYTRYPDAHISVSRLTFGAQTSFGVLGDGVESKVGQTGAVPAYTLLT